MALFMPYTELLLAYTQVAIWWWRQHSRIGKSDDIAVM